MLSDSKVGAAQVRGLCPALCYHQGLQHWCPLGFAEWISDAFVYDLNVSIDFQVFEMLGHLRS